jgi:hypothetical protein
MLLNGPWTHQTTGISIPKNNTVAEEMSGFTFPVRALLVALVPSQLDYFFSTRYQHNTYHSNKQTVLVNRVLTETGVTRRHANLLWPTRMVRVVRTIECVAPMLIRKQCK